MNAQAPWLEVVGLTRRFGDRVALDSLTFEVRRGECLGLLGPNGAGKSTAFQVLVGLLKPDAGVVRQGGVLFKPGDAALRRSWGIVFQSGSLDELLTVRQNLELSAQLYAVPRAQAAARLPRLLQVAGLAARAGERVGTLSGGLKRRLELVRALVHRPALLVLDEPTVGLDEAAFRDFWAELDALRKEETLTILVTTHRPEEAARCDRVCLLDAGRALVTDTPAALAARVGGDIVELDVVDGPAAQAALQARLGLGSRLQGGVVRVEVQPGHQWVARLVEAVGPAQVRSVSVHQPGMADVFLAVAGQRLEARP